MYGEGISATGEVLDIGVDAGVIEKSGSWYAYDGERIGQGRENAKRFLNEHPEMCTEIENKVRLAYGMAPVEMPKASETKETTTDTKEPAKKE